MDDILKNKRVLLVEDNEINHELFTDLLESQQMKVVSAFDGQQALDAIEREAVDLVLMDCQMPVMDGYETTRRLRQQERFENLIILALTANVMQGDREKALQSGMNDLIGKPVDPDAMFGKMAQWIIRAQG